MQQFRLEFDTQRATDGASPVPAFAAGQQVHARVVLQLAEPMKARDVNLHVRGRARVEWNEYEAYTIRDSQGRTHTQRDTICYESEANYIDQRAVLWTSPDQLIPAGQHQFPFTFTIPAHCPPSYEGAFGSINYQCIVCIDRPWKFNKKLESPFIVAPNVDLNSIEWARRPLVQHTGKRIGTFPFNLSRGNLMANIRLAKGGFVCGEHIQIEVEMNNDSGKEVRRVRARLVENATFVASDRGVTYNFCQQAINWNNIGSRHFSQRQNAREVAKLDEPFQLGPRAKGTFRGQLRVPPCAPSSNICPLIQLQYTLEIKIELGGLFSSTCKAQFPILIGTVPVLIRNSADPVGNDGEVAGQEDGGAVVLYPPPPPPPSYSPLTAQMPSAPPQYSEHTSSSS